MIFSRLSMATLLACLSVAGLVTAGELKKPETARLPGISETDWPAWRGLDGTGIADPDQTPPVNFSDTENVIWKAPVTGRGHGSAIVVGSRVFLNAADDAQQVQSLLCLDRLTGNKLWEEEIHRGNFITGGNTKSSHASSTPACDGERVYVNFVNHGAVYTTAVSVKGEKLWSTKISDYVIHQGYGSSPVIHGKLVIVMADNKGGGAIAGLERATGKIVWHHDRPKLPNYPSPAILKINGRDQVLMTGCDLVTSLDPETGKVIWETKGATTECVTTAVTDGQLIFTSGGYPKNHISAVHADGSGKLEWENKVRVYVPSMLVSKGRLYCITDAGVAMCYDSATGKDLFNLRLGGTFSASPILVGDKIYTVNESGNAFVLKVTPDAFEKLAENKVGDDVFAAPTICGSQIFLRVATQAGEKRQEFLYCWGQK